MNVRGSGGVKHGFADNFFPSGAEAERRGKEGTKFDG